jgi:PAS domain S-box-containing protein
MATQLEPRDLLGAFERTGDGVYAVDYDQRIVYWNRTAERLLGHRAEDVLGRECYDVIAGGDFLGHPFCGADCDVIQCARKGHAPASYDVRTRTASGDPRWLNISIVVLAGRSKRSTLAVHMFRDVTEQRRAQLRMKQTAQANVASEAEASPALARLTRREAEVLQYLACGMPTAQMAEVLGVSPATVRNHIEHIIAKLGVHSKLEAVVFAANHRLV